MMLGTGMAATVASFSLLNATVFRPPLPILPEPDRLLYVSITRQAADSPYASHASTHDDFQALQRGIPALTGLAAYTASRLVVAIADEPMAIDGAVVSNHYFATLGMSFAAGGGFTTNSAERRQEVVISYDFWRRHFHGNSVIGAEILVNHMPVQVVGVLAPADLGSPDVWIPFSIAELALRLPDGRPASIEVVHARHFQYRGRLATDATLELARSQATTIARGIESADPSGGRVTVHVRQAPMRSLTQTATRTLGLLAVPLIVLTIACVNAANLLLARATRRRREWATRVAMGASPSRLIRFVLIESLLLATAAAGLGLLASPLILSVVERSLPGTVLTVDLGVVLWTVALTVTTALAFGLGPAIRSAGQAADERSLSASPSPTRTGWALIAVQVTLSLVLLSIGWQFVHAIRASHAALDFRDASRVLVASFDLDPIGRVNDEFYPQLLARTMAAPEVEAVALTNQPMRGGIPSQMIVRAWLRDDAGAEARAVVAMHVEGETAAAALDLRLEGGRWFQPEDREPHLQAIIVNRALADQVFGGQAIGRTLDIAAVNGTTRYPVTVVGVIATSVGRPNTGPALLLPSALSSNRTRTIWLRPRSGQRVDATLLHTVVQSIDPRVPIDEVAIAANYLSPYDPDETAAVSALIVLGIVALLLSAAGLYGLLAYLVSVRAKEFSIRVALGAEPASVARLTVRQAGVSVGIGLACGGVISVAAGLILRSAIYGAPSVDLLALAGAGTVLVVVMVLAAAGPARRAATADPVLALRQE